MIWLGKEHNIDTMIWHLEGLGSVFQIKDDAAFVGLGPADGFK